MFFSLLEGNFVAAHHVNAKDDSIGRYAEQLLGHAQYHANDVSSVESAGADRPTERPLCCYGEKAS